MKSITTKNGYSTAITKKLDLANMTLTGKLTGSQNKTLKKTHSHLQKRMIKEVSSLN